MQQTVRVIATMTALPGKEEQLKAFLLKLIEPSSSRTGCLTYELLQSSTNPGEFVFVEEWESDDAVTAHLNSVLIAEAFRASAELLATPPRVQRYQQLA